MKSPTNAGDQAVEILHHRELLVPDPVLLYDSAWRGAILPFGRCQGLGGTNEDSAQATQMARSGGYARRVGYFLLPGVGQTPTAPFSAAGSVRVLLSKLVVALLAHGHFAPRQADLGKDGGVETKRLVHVRHDLDDFVDEIAILILDDLGDEAQADRLMI